VSENERKREEMISILEAHRNPPLTSPLPAPAERKSIRERYGVTQQVLADIVGVSRLSVSTWEREGGSEPTGERARKYAQALKEMKEVIDREESK
jgi:DNA-binding transcriptional regulator YiaG